MNSFCSIRWTAGSQLGSDADAERALPLGLLVTAHEHGVWLQSLTRHDSEGLWRAAAEVLELGRPVGRGAHDVFLFLPVFLELVQDAWLLLLLLLMVRGSFILR